MDILSLLVSSNSYMPTFLNTYNRSYAYFIFQYSRFKEISRLEIDAALADAWK